MIKWILKEENYENKMYGNQNNINNEKIINLHTNINNINNIIEKDNIANKNK